VGRCLTILTLRYVAVLLCCQEQALTTNVVVNLDYITAVQRFAVQIPELFFQNDRSIRLSVVVIVLQLILILRYVVTAMPFPKGIALMLNAADSIRLSILNLRYVVMVRLYTNHMILLMNAVMMKLRTTEDRTCVAQADLQWFVLTEQRHAVSSRRMTHTQRFAVTVRLSLNHHQTHHSAVVLEAPSTLSHRNAVEIRLFLSTRIAAMTNRTIKTRTYAVMETYSQVMDREQVVVGLLVMTRGATSAWTIATCDTLTMPSKFAAPVLYTISPTKTVAVAELTNLMHLNIHVATAFYEEKYQVMSTIAVVSGKMKTLNYFILMFM